LQPIALAVGAGLLGFGAVYLGCQFFACKKKPPSLRGESRSNPGFEAQNPGPLRDARSDGISCNLG
jgi:hypothetical protein